MFEQMLLYSFLAGITVFIGGLLANTFNHHIKETPFKYQVTHSVASFGGGIILAAVALVLVPTAMESLPLLNLVIAFLVGAALFMLVDKLLSGQGGKTATLLAMMLDFVPESIALGAVFVVDQKTGILLAIFIALQNLPEAFNSFRDLVLSGMSQTKTLVIFFGLSFTGVAGALIGHFFLREHPSLTAHLMMFASGGILYLLIQDIIPDSKLEGSFSVSFAATLGFLVGVIGEKLV